MKRFLAVFLMLAILLTGLTVTANAATTGWKKLDDGTWTYVKADGKLATDEWIKDGDKWYYFVGTTMLENISRKIKDTWYAFDKKGAMASNGWIQCRWTDYDDLEWYYANADGSLVKGWKKIDGKWYYFYGGQSTETLWDPYMYNSGFGYIKDVWYVFAKSGEMLTGWVQPWLEGGIKDWVYANADGACQRGWQKIDGKWYYFEADKDEWPFMYDDTYGLVEMSDKNIYTFDKSGAMVTGWKKLDGTWYYFKDSGAMLKSDWVKGGDGKWYYLKDDGEMAASETLTIKGKEYKFDANGAWIEK